MDGVSLEPAMLAAADRGTDAALAKLGGNDRAELRSAFRQAIAGTLYRSLITQLRKGVPEGTLMHGGRMEEVFQTRLEETLAERMAEEHGGTLADPMLEAFLLGREDRSPLDALPRF
jgi:hypothetical protein